MFAGFVKQDYVPTPKSLCFCLTAWIEFVVACIAELMGVYTRSQSAPKRIAVHLKEEVRILGRRLAPNLCLEAQISIVVFSISADMCPILCLVSQEWKESTGFSGRQPRSSSPSVQQPSQRLGVYRRSSKVWKATALVAGCYLLQNMSWFVGNIEPAKAKAHLYFKGTWLFSYIQS